MQKIVVVFPLPTFLYYWAEKFLEKLSSKGWILTKYNDISFTFEKTAPKRKCYFIYHSSGIRKDEGKFSLTLRHWNIPDTYGLRNSKLNMYSRRTSCYHKIVEVDTEKANGEGFAELIQDRERLYFYESLRDISLLIILGLILCYIMPKIIGRILVFLGLAYFALSLISRLLKKLYYQTDNDLFTNPCPSTMFLYSPIFRSKLKYGGGVKSLKHLPC